MEKTLKTIQVKSGAAEMVIYQENINLAINNGWDSLYFAKNSADFAWISDGKTIIALSTKGEVNVCRCNEVLYNEHEDKIRNLLNSGIDIYEGDAVQDGNWFSLEIGKVINHEKYSIVDEYPFDSTPMSFEELEDLLIQIFDYENQEGYTQL